MSKILTLRQHAKAGDPVAQLALARVLLVGREAPRALGEALALIDAACKQNYVNAFLVQATLALLGLGRPRSFDDAIAWLVRAAAQGDPRAKGQLEALGGEKGFDPSFWTSIPPTTQHFAAPRIFTYDNFVPPAACAWIIANCQNRTRRATVYDPTTGGPKESEERTNSIAIFGQLEPDLVVQLINLRVAGVTGVPFMHQEDTGVFRYEVGQEFKPHYDFFVGAGNDAYGPELQQLGQRIGTFLIYLNQDYEGGETAFPRLNWRLKAQTGQALLFWNVSAAGALEPLSFHAGLPVAKGEKWIISKWMRARPVPLDG